jgi:hypothetical protein
MIIAEQMQFRCQFRKVFFKILLSTLALFLNLSQTVGHMLLFPCYAAFPPKPEDSHQWNEHGWPKWIHSSSFSAYTFAQAGYS